MTNLVGRFGASIGFEGSGLTLTQSAKQLGFAGRDKLAAFNADLAAPIRSGELSGDRSRKIKETVRSGFELPESMTESNPRLDHERQRHNRWLVLIAAYKFLLAALFVAVGVGALRLMHKDIDDVITHLGDLLRFNPESRFVNFLYDRAPLINDPLLKRIGALAFSYAGLSLAEGIGLYLEKAWGEFLTLAITASFLPWEIFEVFHRLTWVRVGLLGVNLMVFVYLLRIVVDRRKPAVPLVSE
ncbi:MAG: DUF2127 domain-containing protein [Terracidiphilus sp.]